MNVFLLLLPALVSAVIAAVVSWLGVAFNVRQRSILEARQRWRDELRRLLPEFTASDSANDRERLRGAITLHLNPYKDQHLIASLDSYVREPTVATGRIVIDTFSEYLKYDWQRAKAEALHSSRCADRRAAKEVGRQRRERDAGAAVEPQREPRRRAS